MVLRLSDTGRRGTTRTVAHGETMDWYELEQQLAVARDRLDTFERQTINRHVIERLRQSSPFHPFFLLRSLAVVLSILLGIAGVAVMITSMVERDVAVIVSRIEEASVLPLPVAFGLLAGCGLLFALCAHLALLVVGRSAPLLPHEAREHQRLVSDVKRIEATMAVQSRLTPSPAGPRSVTGA